MTRSFPQALELAKDFTAPRKKHASQAPRPALCGAFVEKPYVWATDSIWLIRIKHDVDVESPYIFGYTSEDMDFFSSDGATYPNLNFIIPRTEMVCKLKIDNVEEWLNVHEQVCLMKHHRFHATLNTYEKTVTATSREKVLSADFIYRDLSFEKVGTEDITIYYNASLMAKILKMFKKLKVSEIQISIFGQKRPIVIESDDILVLMLPYANEYYPTPEVPKKEPKPKKVKEPKPKPEPKPKKVKEPKPKPEPKPKKTAKAKTTVKEKPKRKRVKS